MADYIVNPTNQQIRQTGENIKSLFDPRRAAAGQNLQAQRELTQQRTATEVERTRGLKGSNDAYDTIDSDITTLFNKHGLDPANAPLAATILKAARSHNPQQFGELITRFISTHKLLSSDPADKRTGMLLNKQNPTLNTAVTPEEGTAIRSEKSASAEKIQGMRDTQSGLNQESRNKQSGLNQQARIAARPGANPELAALNEEVKQSAIGLQKATDVWNKQKTVQGMGNDPKTNKPPFQGDFVPIEKDLEKARADHMALVARRDKLAQELAARNNPQGELPVGPGAPPPGAASLFPGQPQPAPTVPVAPPAAAAPVVPGQGFGFGANASPSAPLTPGQNTITLGQPTRNDPNDATQVEAAIAWIKANPRDPRVPQIMKHFGIQ